MGISDEFGPLVILLGKWEGEKGLDISPDPEGERKTVFKEFIVFESVGSVRNAKRQTLFVVRYIQRVFRKDTEELFHDEVGYWAYSPEDKRVIHSLVIPRGVAVVAEGTWRKLDDGKIYIKVEADKEGICQSIFMRENARTEKFLHEVWLDSETLKYREITYLSIYGRDFEHIDENELRKIK